MKCSLLVYLYYFLMNLILSDTWYSIINMHGFVRQSKQTLTIHTTMLRSTIKRRKMYQNQDIFPMDSFFSLSLFCVTGSGNSNIYLFSSFPTLFFLFWEMKVLCSRCCNMLSLERKKGEKILFFCFSCQESYRQITKK